MKKLGPEQKDKWPDVGGIKGNRGDGSVCLKELRTEAL